MSESKVFPMVARRAFRLPDGMTIERGQVFSAGVRSRVKDMVESFILTVPGQLEAIVIPCQFVAFSESEERISEEG